MNRIGLGIDVGGTATRWQLKNGAGVCMAEGALPGLTGVIHDQHQRSYTMEILSKLMDEVTQHGQPTHVVAGITGYGGWVPGNIDDVFHHTLNRRLPQARMLLLSDVLLSYFCVFEPGEGYLAYSGTGSVSAYVDQHYVLHRAGGRGYVIDDAGGGFWMAREALRRIWQMRDAQPEAHLHSPLALALFKSIGGCDWAHTRDFIYTRKRGDIGRLATHLGAFVEIDPIAHQVVTDAGIELARLVKALQVRHGLRPVAVAGGAAHIHPVYFESLKSALPVGTDVRLLRVQVEQHASRLAIQASESLWQGIQAASSTTT